MASLYNDGSIPYGSVVLTINAVTYIAENFSIDRPTAQIDRRNELNEPTGSVGIAEFVTGSATLQMAASATATPPLGNTFAHESETFYITQVGQVLAQGDAKKFTISFRKKIN